MSCSRRLVILAFYPFSSHDFLITKSGTRERVVSGVQPVALLKSSGERSLHYNVCRFPDVCAFRACLAATPSLRRAAETDPHPGK